MTVGHDYISTLIDYDIYGNIKNFKKDVIIIHGTADHRVPIRYSEKAVETYKSATLYRIQGANHGFNSDNYPLGKSSDFVLPEKPYLKYRYRKSGSRTVAALFH